MCPKEIVNDYCYNNMPINASASNPCYGEVLDKTLEMMRYMVEAHSKVMFIRLDVRYPGGYPVQSDNRVFIDFLENFMQNLRRQGLDPQRIWAREQEDASNPHYHICLFVNGNKVQSIYGIRAVAERLWALALGISSAAGLIWDCTEDSHGNPQQNGIRIDRNAPDFPQVFQDCYYWASYLAKTRGKEETPHRVRCFGYNRFPVR